MEIVRGITNNSKKVNSLVKKAYEDKPKKTISPEGRGVGLFTK